MVEMGGGGDPDFFGFKWAWFFFLQIFHFASDPPNNSEWMVLNVLLY